MKHMGLPRRVRDEFAYRGAVCVSWCGVRLVVQCASSGAVCVSWCSAVWCCRGVRVCTDLGVLQHIVRECCIHCNGARAHCGPAPTHHECDLVVREYGYVGSVAAHGPEASVVVVGDVESWRHGREQATNDLDACRR